MLSCAARSAVLVAKGAVVVTPIAAAWRRQRVLRADAAAPPRAISASLVPAARALAVPPAPSSAQLMALLLRELQPDWPLLLLTAGTAVATAAVSLAIPAATGELVNVLVELSRRAVDKAETAAGGLLVQALRMVSNAEINAAALKLAGLFAANGALTFAYVAMVSQVGENLAERLRTRLFRSFVQQDVCFFDERKSGDLLNRLTADVQNFKSSVKSTISQGLKALTQTVGGIASLYMLSPPLTIFMCSTLPLLYGVGSLYGRYLRHLSESARHADASSTAIANECLSNVRTVRAFAMEDVESERYGDAVGEASAQYKFLGLHIGLFQGLNTLALSGMFVSVLYFGGYLVSNGFLNAPKLMSYLMSTQNTQRALATLVVLYGSVTKALGAGVRVYEYMDLQPRVPKRGGLAPLEICGDIEFRGVRFSYPCRPERVVLESFSLVIPRGKIVALVGQSGGGKSTIAALLERFYEPDGGEILLDGRPLRELDPSWLRTSIGYINQEPVLFGGSVLQNIRYGRPGASDAEVIEAARLANADDFIRAFPAGYETLVGERGVTLSGGQRQRIAIARALLKNPRILLLDEATSALDADSEKLVQEALDRLMKGRTVLVIAHRLSTIRTADVICVLGPGGGGRIVEQGTHDQLVARGGVYAGLYASARAPAATP